MVICSSARCKHTKLIKTKTKKKTENRNIFKTIEKVDICQKFSLPENKCEEKCKIAYYCILEKKNILNKNAAYIHTHTYHCMKWINSTDNCRQSAAQAARFQVICFSVSLFAIKKCNCWLNYENVFCYNNTKMLKRRRGKQMWQKDEI